VSAGSPSLSLRPGLAQRPGRGYVPPGLHIHESELAQDLGGKRLAVRGPGGRERTVQHHGSFAVETAYRVHERGAQGRQHICQHERIPGALGFLGRPTQRLDAGVG
jgi:hypothetical protein